MFSLTNILEQWLCILNFETNWSCPQKDTSVCHVGGTLDFISSCFYRACFVFGVRVLNVIWKKQKHSVKLLVLKAGQWATAAPSISYDCFENVHVNIVIDVRETKTWYSTSGVTAFLHFSLAHPPIVRSLMNASSLQRYYKHDFVCFHVCDSQGVQ